MHWIPKHRNPYGHRNNQSESGHGLGPGSIRRSDGGGFLFQSIQIREERADESSGDRKRLQPLGFFEFFIHHAIKLVLDQGAIVLPFTQTVDWAEEPSFRA